MISDMFIKVIALGIIGTFLAVLLKKNCKELLPFFEVAIVVAAVCIIVDESAFDNSSIKKVFEIYSRSTDLFMCMFKGAAVTMLTKLASGVCRESGNGLMGDIVELGGRTMLIFLTMPYIEKVTETALAFLK